MSPEQYATEALDQATGDSLRELSRGGSRPGAGRKPKSADGEAMKTRQVRMTNQQWSDLKLVTADAMRAWVTRQAKKLRGE